MKTASNAIRLKAALNGVIYVCITRTNTFPYPCLTLKKEEPHRRTITNLESTGTMNSKSLIDTSIHQQ